MNKYIGFMLLLLACCCTTPQQAQAQAKCSYDEALGLFNQGNVDEAIKVLQCMEEKKGGMDKIDLANMYWLLVRCYSLRKQGDLAKEYYGKMLERRPRFQPDSTDMEDIKLIHSKLLPTPKIAFYISGGPMHSFESIKRRHYVLQDPANAGKSYNTAFIRHQAGLGVYFKPAKYLQFHLEVQQYGQAVAYTRNITNTISRYNITRKVDPITQNTLSIDTVGFIQNILDIENRHEQKFNYLSIPFFLRAGMNFSKKTQGFVEGGGYINFLLNAPHTVNVEEKDVTKSFLYKSPIVDTYETTKNSVNAVAVQELYRRFNGGFIAGMGMRTLVNNKWYVIAGARYQYSILNIVNQEKRFNDTALLGYYDTVDDFTLSALSFNFGLEIPIRYKTYTIKTR